MIYFIIAAEKQATLVHDEVPLEENINRLETEGDEARNVEDAITMLRYAYFFDIDHMYFHSTLIQLPSASVFIKHATMISIQTLFQILHVSRMTGIEHIINSVDPHYYFRLFFSHPLDKNIPFSHLYII